MDLPTSHPMAVKAATDYKEYLGSDIQTADVLHDGRQNVVIKVVDKDGMAACIRYRTAVEFWYEDCLKEPFIESLGIVDIPKVYYFNDTVRPQILISEFVEGPLLHEVGVTEEVAVRVGKLIAALHVPSKGSTNYLDFVAGKVSNDSWSDGFIASLQEEALACGFSEAEIADFLTFARTLFASYTNDKLVLVHNDIHFKNILLRLDGSLCLLDWDSAVVAPSEKDFVKLLDWSHQNTAVVSTILETYQEQTGKKLDMAVIDVFRVYACLRQIHFQGIVLQKGVQSEKLEQKGFFGSNQQNLSRLNEILNSLGFMSWGINSEKG